MNIKRYDVHFINPLGNVGTLYAVEAESVQEACGKAPYALAVNSHWRPDQFEVTAAQLSIYTTEEDHELRQN